MPLWLHWIVLGFIAGALAKYLMPGRDPSGCIVTTVLGMLGASIGGLIGTRLGWGRVTAARFDWRSLVLATLGAVVILAAGRLVKGIMSGTRRRHRTDALLWHGRWRDRESRPKESRK